MSISPAAYPASAVPTTTGLRRIVCAAEASPAGTEAVRQAALIAGADTALDVVAVAPARPSGAHHPVAGEMEALVAAGAAATALGVQAELKLLEAECPADALIDRARGADLLVVPPGDAAAALIARAPMPLLVARRAPDGSEVTESVLVAVDGTPAAHAAVAFAGSIAKAHGSLTALVAAPEHDMEHQSALRTDVAALEATTGRTPLVLDEQCPPVAAILAAATSVGATLVVVGRRQGEYEGRVSAAVAERSNRSVLIARQFGAG